MSCCGNNNTNYYARVNDNYRDAVLSSNDDRRSCLCAVNGNGDLRDRLKRLINRKAVVTADGDRVCVIICEVCCCFVKAINYRCNRVVYFNINRIDNVEDILPD